jgi:Golgi phosphoprotein 3 (GPP34)
VPSLSLPETLLLLGFDADQGTTTLDAMSLSYALGGAQLSELALAGRVTVDPERVVVSDATRTGDGELDELLAKIVSTRDQPRRPGHWVMRRKSKAVPLYMRRLVHTGVLSSRRTRILGLIPRRIFPIVDQGLHGQAHEEIVAALADPAPPEPRTAALIALVSAVGLSERLIGDPVARERAAQLAADDAVASSVKRAVGAVRGG